jgi:hypothetical protein
MSPDLDRFSDEYDPEPDLDRPTRAEAEADERPDWASPEEWAELNSDIEWRTAAENERAREEDDETEYVGPCPLCGAQVPPDAHAEGCPVVPGDDLGDEF